MARVPDAEPPQDMMVQAANIFRALANNRQVLKGFSDLGGRLLFRSSLEGRTREAVILRMGAVLGSNYEWGQHVRIGREAGLGDDEIRGIHDGSLTGLSEVEQVAVRYGEAVERREVTDELWAATRKHFTDEQMVDLTVLAGFYGLVSRSLIALDVQLDDGVFGLDQP